MDKFNFQYELNNLHVSINDIFGAGEFIFLIILSVLIIIVTLFIYNLYPYFYWYYLLLKEEKEKKSRKKKLQELLLFKDVQTQIEKEIEEEFLKTLNTVA